MVAGIQVADARSEDKFPCTCNAVSAVVKIFTYKAGTWVVLFIMVCLVILHLCDIAICHSLNERTLGRRFNARVTTTNVWLLYFCPK
jgi:hypothetical protein